MGGEAANVGKWLGASYTYFSSLALCQEICNARPGCTGVDHAGIESSGYGGGSQCYLTLDGCSEGLTSSGNWAHFAINLGYPRAHIPGTPTALWGDIGDWDVSSVEDFSHAFSKHRDVAGLDVENGNPKAATFVGTAMSKWTTTSATSLERTFTTAGEMNSDLSGWNVAKVTTLASTFSGAPKFTGAGLGSWDTAAVTTLTNTFYKAGEMNSDFSGWNVAKVTELFYTFNSASKFTGTGLPSWNIAKVTAAPVSGFYATFTSAKSITSCNKRLIADAWKSNSAFANAASPSPSSWKTAWAANACPPLTDATFKQASWGT